MRKFYLAAFLILGIAASSMGATIVDLTQIGVGARPLGMGRAFTAVADDASAIFMNPAGLAGTRGINIISMTGNLIDEVPYLVAAQSWETRYGYFGIGYIASSLGGIKEAVLIGSTPEVTGNLADYSASSLVFSAANQAANIDLVNRITFLTDLNTSLGISFKLANHGFSGAPSFEGAAMSGYNLDFGALFCINPETQGSLVIKNILSSSRVGRDTLPFTPVLGLAFDLARYRTLATTDIEFTRQGALLHLGGEWSPLETLFLRGGLDQNPDGIFNLALGVGTRFRGFTFDYAYHTYAELSEFTSHYFSIGYIGQ